MLFMEMLFFKYGMFERGGEEGYITRFADADADRRLAGAGTRTQA
jgi:hypothetical protein